MANPVFIPVSGVIENVTSDPSDCCRFTVTLRSQDIITNIIITADTYVIKEIRLRRGLYVTAFYDSSVPVPLIYPAQYEAVVIGQHRPNEFMAFGYYDENLTAADNSLQLNLGITTSITTCNGQTYACSPAGKLLIVYYSVTTFSLPPQTTPHKIIVMC